jgi:hypothetical protein
MGRREAAPYGGASQYLKRKRGRQPGKHKDPLTIECCEAIKAIVEANHPHKMKVRQIAYQMSANYGHLIGKDEADFAKVQRLVAMMRRDIDFHRHYPHLELDLESIVDGARELQQTYTEDSVSDALVRTADQYRLNVHAEANTFVLFLVEKDGLIDTLRRVIDDYDVPIVAQPFTSISNQFTVAKLIMQAAEDDKPAIVYHLGDYDPSGKTMFTSVCADLVALLRDRLDCPEDYTYGDHDWIEAATARFDPKRGARCIKWSQFCEPDRKLIRWASPKLTIERLGLTRHMVDAYCSHGIRPTKRGGNTHAQRFPDDDSCELDALTPNVLRNLVRRAIERHIPKALVNKVRAKQAKEQKQLLKLANQFS